jgi:hypothetical protein
MNRKGSMAVVVIVLVVLIVIILGVWYLGSNNNANTSTTGGTSSTTTSASSKTQSISALIGGTIELGDGSSVIVPAGMLKQDEVITLSEVSQLPDVLPNKSLSKVGNGLMLKFSIPAYFNGTQIHATTTSGLEFVINMGNNNQGLSGSAPISWVANSSGNNLLGANGSYSTSTNEATIYVGADYLGIVSSTEEVDVGMINFAVGPSQNLITDEINTSTVSPTAQTSPSTTEAAKEQRDSIRVSDLATLHSTMMLYLADVSNPKLGCTDTKTIYASSPITPPSGWKAGAHMGSTAVNGTGWIPIDFNAISSGAPIGKLPIDPLNDPGHHLVYLFACNPIANTYEIDAVMESQQYNKGGSTDMVSTDGGNDQSIYEVGTDLTLIPNNFWTQ